jgi:hypothetical protein
MYIADFFTQFDSVNFLSIYIYCRDLNIDFFKVRSVPNIVIEIDLEIKWPGSNV